MPKKSPNRKLKGCLIISPIADDGTKQRAAIHKRAKYLEKQIADALRPLGYEAALITSDKGKHWITPHMIRRLTSDPLTVAVLDGANPNCMYEIGIRHAVCLPMIFLIEKSSAGPRLPFNVQDVDPLQYPPLRANGTWDTRARKNFRTMVQKRAKQAIKDRPSNNFIEALDRISDRTSARRMLRMIFSQKQLELGFLKKDLEEYLHFVRKDYEINVSIGNDAAERLFKLLDSNNDRLMHRNDVLHDLIRRTELACLGDLLDPCFALCKRITTCADELADLARTLKTAISAGSSSSRPTLPTRRKVEKNLKGIIQALDTLDEDLVTLLQDHAF